MGIIRFGIAVLAGGAMASALSCSHAPPPPAPPPLPPLPALPSLPPPPPPCTTPEPLRITVQASAQINPGEKGEALATVVRLYQLKGAGRLQGASFDDVLDHDKETLAEELVAVNEVTINPGERLEPPIARNADAAYVAAVALFRRPSGNTWRAIRKLAPPDPQHCHAGGGAKASAPDAGKTRFALDENRIDLR